MAAIKAPKNRSIFVTIEGGEELIKSLAVLPPTIEKQVMRPALRLGARGALWEIQRRVPTDEGDLYRSLKVRAIARSRTKIGSRVIISQKTLKMEGREGFYASSQELGWSPGKRGANRRGNRVAGRRFMRAGLYDHANAIKNTVVREARKQYPKAVAKARAKGKL